MNPSYFWGDLGHLFVLLSFVSAVGLAGSGGATALKRSRPARPQGSVSVPIQLFFIAHAISLVGMACCLYVLLFQGRYDYHYVWSHSSVHLPTEYKISCLWEGQEGSFLLWMLFHAVIMGFWLRVRHGLCHEVLSLLALMQGLLCSMLLGVEVGTVSVGSSPFSLTKDMVSWPIFQAQPFFVPADGQGLNPLLQNYWMVIHPPVLFAGFALMSVPFALAVSGLWTKQYLMWMDAARRWTLVGLGVLALGIAMGAYWAYETLNFGGYWNWDPVENAVYVPWLVSLASVHALRLSQRQPQYTKWAALLGIATLCLIWYATFLIRSGILGDSSVHAFTDAGLGYQLIFVLCLLTGLSFGLWIVRCRHMSQGFDSVERMPFWSAETGMVLGMAVLFLTSFQVLVPTSLPVIDAFIGWMDAPLRLAPPTDAIHYYSHSQLWFAIAVAVLSAWIPWIWRPFKEMRKGLHYLLIATLAAASLCTLLFNMQDIRYILLLTAALFSLSCQGYGLWVCMRSEDVSKKSAVPSALSHLGIALVLVGILFSSTQEKLLSLNHTGKLWHNDFPDEINEESMLLFRNEVQRMPNFVWTYEGMYKKTNQGMMDIAHLLPTEDPTRWKVKRRPTAVVRVREPKKSYFKIVHVSDGGRESVFFPSVQQDASQLVYSPHIRRGWFKDLYVHVRTFPDSEKQTWSLKKEQWLHRGDTFFVNDYVATLHAVGPARGHGIEDVDAVLEAHIRVQAQREVYDVKPKLLVRKQELGLLSETLDAVGARLTLINVEPNEEGQKERFLLRIEQGQKPWIIVEATEKPFINLLWMGIVLLIAGMGWALVQTQRR